MTHVMNIDHFVQDCRVQNSTHRLEAIKTPSATHVDAFQGLFAVMEEAM